ncbi:MAG: rRNA pseudouridine synthase [Acidobacteria bacterium]|nr:rRNA pseudouridine synthase [Acidobacteriota bacterium]
MALERLQKIISRSGLASRRHAEDLILAGRVSVNGAVVRELGSKADLQSDRVQLDGKLIRPPRTLVYLALHKPRGCVTTRSDPQGRPIVMDFLKGIKERVYPIGRLDYASEGLLFLTNDGEFANCLMSAVAGIPKTYWVKVTQWVSEEDLHKLRRGIVLGGRPTRPAQIRRLASAGRKLSGKGRGESINPWYEVILQEGRQNQIRRMFARIGHPVRKLKRVSIGAVTLGNLQPGQCRHLSQAEVRRLMKEADANQGH